MYKLLLISDKEDVLNAFGEITDWEMHGFRQPHIRHDLEGARESLQKHHADGIAIALDADEEEKTLLFLQESYPTVSIFEAGRNKNEVLRYLNELKILLNRIHADFSNDGFGEQDLLMECRHDFFRKVLTGRIARKEDLYRNMRLLRSRMDADRPCLLLELTQPASGEDKLEGRWQDTPDRLELLLRKTFGLNVQGLHILPTVHPDGRILILACPLHGEDHAITGDSMTAMMTNLAADSIEHLKEYQGLELHITGIRVLPTLTALCGDANV